MWTTSTTTTTYEKPDNIENIFKREVLTEKLDKVQEWLQRSFDKYKAEYEEWLEIIAPEHKHVQDIIKSFEDDTTLIEAKRIFNDLHQSEMRDTKRKIHKKNEEAKERYRKRVPLMYKLFGYFFMEPKMRSLTCVLPPSVTRECRNKAIEQTIEQMKDRFNDCEHFTVKFSHFVKQYPHHMDYNRGCGGSTFVHLYLGDLPVYIFITVMYTDPVRFPSEIENRLNYVKTNRTLIHDEGEYVTVSDGIMREIRNYETALAASKEKTE